MTESEDGVFGRHLEMSSWALVVGIRLLLKKVIKKFVLFLSCEFIIKKPLSSKTVPKMYPAKHNYLVGHTG